MLKKKNKTKEEEIKEIRTKTYIYFLVFVVGLILLSIMKNFNQNNEVEVKKEETISVNDKKILDEFTYKLKDNYSLRIKKYNENKEYSLLEYKKDKNIQMLTGNSLLLSGYTLYNNKIYTFINDKLTKVGKIEYQDEIKKEYYDIDFLMNIIRKSTCTYKSTNNLICTIGVVEYINEYNKQYNSSFQAQEDKKITFEIKNFKYINKIIVNYNEISKILFNKEDNSDYQIEILDIDNNNYDDKVDIIKKLKID